MSDKGINTEINADINTGKRILPGLPVVLSAPSGAGKTTLARRVLSEFEDAVISVSYTTRKPRGTEKHGVDYFFVDDKSFDKMLEEGAFAEWAKVHRARYGTPRAEVDARLADGEIVLFDIDVQGGEQIQAAYPAAVTILISTPDMQILEQRLRDRSTDDDDAIAHRLSVAGEELKRASKSYSYLVINDDLDKACLDLFSIINAERCRLSRLIDYLPQLFTR